MGIRENKIEHYLNKEFISRGGLTRKWISPGHAGVPDRICILKGHILFIEIKTIDGITKQHQIHEQKRLVDAGCTVRVIRGKSDVCKLIQEIDNEFNK